MREPSWSLVPVAKCGLSSVGRLPPQQLQRAAAATLGRRVAGLGLCHRHAASGEQLSGHRRAQANGHHPSDEAAPRQAARPDAVDQAAKFALFHRCPLWRVWPRPLSGGALADRANETKAHSMAADNTGGRQRSFRETSETKSLLSLSGIQPRATNQGPERFLSAEMHNSPRRVPNRVANKNDRRCAPTAMPKGAFCIPLDPDAIVAAIFGASKCPRRKHRPVRRKAYRHQKFASAGCLDRAHCCRSDEWHRFFKAVVRGRRQMAGSS